MMPEKPKIEIRLAYTWTCEECGRDNSCHAISPQYDTELEWQMKEHFGYGMNDGGQFMMSPSRVTCGHCHETFETQDRGGEEEGDDAVA